MSKITQNSEQIKLDLDKILRRYPFS